MTPPTEDDTRARAYHLWEAAGRPAGRDAEFWAAAEGDPAAKPVAVVPLAAPAALNGLMAAVSQFDDAMTGLIVGSSFTPGWEVKHERPGESLPTVRRFFGGAERSIDPAFEEARLKARDCGAAGIVFPDGTTAAPGFVRGTFCAVDPAAPNQTDRAVVAEMVMRNDGPPVVRLVTLMEQGDPGPPVGVVTGPDEIAGRLVRLAAECEAADERFRRVMLARKAARQAALASAACAAPPAPVPPAPPVAPEPPKRPGAFARLRGRVARLFGASRASRG